MARKDLRPEDCTVIIDTREQTPLDVSPLKSQAGTLPTADYSILGLENVVAVERKSLPDLMACIGRERERFDREIMRLIAYPSRLLVVEGHLAQIQLKQYRANVEPSAALGSIMGWMARGIPILFANSHEEAGKMTARFLFIAARRRWDEAQGLCAGLKIAE